MEANLSNPHFISHTACCYSKNLWRSTAISPRPSGIREPCIPFTHLHLPNLKVLSIKDEGAGSSITSSARESIVIQSHASSLRDVSFTTGNAAVDTHLYNFCTVFRAFTYPFHLVQNL